MRDVERVVAREARAMTKAQIIVRAIEGRITWIQAAAILGVSDRHMRRLKERYERDGYDGLRDCRGGKPRRKRIPVETIAKICQLKESKYADFSVQHFYEQITEKHDFKISYTWTLLALQEAGLVEKTAGRGRYRRRRDRRPMTGMLLHLDASTHEWIAGKPYDLNVVLDDADGRILYAEFVEEEGLASTFSALHHVLRRYGRFGELYTDRGSHFCHTPLKGGPPADDQNGNVARALRTLGIRQILARSPEARGRSERCFGTLQGRLPQELRLLGITDYDSANRYLQGQFIPDFNRRFAVKPQDPETAFVALLGVDLDLLLSVQHERVVRRDNTVTFNNLVLQIPELRSRPDFSRCPVTVHEFTDGTLGISYQNKLLGRFTRDGELLTTKRRRRAA